MSGSGIYKNYRRQDALLRSSGYVKAWINALSDFVVLAEPDDLTTDSITGDNKIIANPHQWVDGRAAYSLFINQKTLEAPGESTGEAGSQRLKWTLKCFLKGDGPIAQDLAESWMNEQVICFIQDECPNPEFIQFGCNCLPGEMVKNSFSSGTLTGGIKGWQFEIEFYCRFFYFNPLAVNLNIIGEDGNLLTTEEGEIITT